MSKMVWFEQEMNFEEICAEGLEAFLEEEPHGTDQGFADFMIQRYYGLLVRCGEDMTRANLAAFAEQHGLPKGRS